jgi:acyl-CoA-binding protein
MKPARAGLLVAIFALAASTVACRSYTLTQPDCEEYRAKLEAWAKAKGKQSKEAAEKFAKSCPGTVISKRTHDCLEKAGDETAFFQCLD